MPRIQLRRVGESGFFHLPVELSHNRIPEKWEHAALLVDSGASTLFMRDGFARGLGYEPGPPMFNVGGLTGTQLLPTIRDVGLRLGGAETIKAYFSLVPILPLESGMPEPVAGLAGFRLFQHLRATLAIDYDTNLATLSWP